MRQLFIGAVIALVLQVPSPWSEADTTTHVLDGVVVEDARATPTRAGERMILRFSVENTSGRTIVLEGVRSEAAEASSLFIVENGFYRRQAGELVLLDQETLDLGTSHIGAALTGLCKDYRIGDVIDFELVFRSGTVAASAHVHEEEQPTSSRKSRCARCSFVRACSDVPVSSCKLVAPPSCLVHQLRSQDTQL